MLIFSPVVLSQIVIEEGIDLEVFPLSEDEQGFGEDSSQASADHSSCPKTTVGPDENTVKQVKLFLTSAKNLLSGNVIQVINLINKKYFLF